MGFKSSVGLKRRLGFVAGWMLKRCKAAIKGSQFRDGTKVLKPFAKRAVVLAPESVSGRVSAPDLGCPASEVVGVSTATFSAFVEHSFGGFCPGGCLEEVFVLFWGFYDFGVCVFRISVAGGWVFFSPCSFFQVGGDLSGSFGFLFSAPGSSYQIWWDTSGSFFFRGGWVGEEVVFIFSSCVVGF
jgi:hypothetical protein